MTLYDLELNVLNLLSEAYFSCLIHYNNISQWLHSRQASPTSHSYHHWLLAPPHLLHLPWSCPLHPPGPQPLDHYWKPPGYKVQGHTGILHILPPVHIPNGWIFTICFYNFQSVWIWIMDEAYSLGHFLGPTLTGVVYDKVNNFQ